MSKLLWAIAAIVTAFVVRRSGLINGCHERYIFIKYFGSWPHPSNRLTQLNVDFKLTQLATQVQVQSGYAANEIQCNFFNALGVISDLFGRYRHFLRARQAAENCGHVVLPRWQDYTARLQSEREIAA